MKKAISLLLALVLCLSLTACGKSEAVKNVEAMIDALMGSTEYNVEEIEAIYAAFAELSEKEQTKVGNYDDFCELSDNFYASTLIGTWYPFELWIGELEKSFSPHFYIVLNADHTFESVAGEEGSGGRFRDHAAVKEHGASVCIFCAELYIVRNKKHTYTF